MTAPLGTQLEPHTGLIWCLVVVGAVMLLPALHALRRAVRGRTLRSWAGAAVLALALVALPLGLAWGLHGVRYYLGEGQVSAAYGDERVTTLQLADIDRIELRRIGGFNGLVLVDEGAPRGQQPEFSVSWATADLGPLIVRLEEEIADRPMLLDESERDHWVDAYLSRV